MTDGYKRVEFPEFELYGPPCENSNCKGVLTQFYDFNLKMYFKRCSVCDCEFEQISAEKVMENLDTYITEFVGTKDE